MSDNPSARYSILAIACFFALTFTTSCNNGNTPKNSQSKDSTVAATNDTVPAGAANSTDTPPPISLDTAAKTTVADTNRPAAPDTGKRYIYLTWDDGPQPPGSSNCFDIFKRAGVKATFFCIAVHNVGAERNAWVDSIRNSYPQYLLANHSKTHAFNDHYIDFYHHPHAALQDFLEAQQKLAVPQKIVRLPGNSAWVRTGEVKASGLVKPVCELLDSAGYNVIGWDEEWGFKTVNQETVPRQGAETMARMIDRDFKEHHLHTHNALVLLAHDRMFARANYADSLVKCINILKQDPRYVFETIDHYPGIKRGQ